MIRMDIFIRNWIYKLIGGEYAQQVYLADVTNLDNVNVSLDYSLIVTDVYVYILGT